MDTIPLLTTDPMPTAIKSGTSSSSSSLPKLKMAPFFLEEEGSDSSTSAGGGGEEDSSSRSSSQKDYTEFSTTTDSHTSIEDFVMKGDLLGGWGESAYDDKIDDDFADGGEKGRKANGIADGEDEENIKTLELRIPTKEEAEWSRSKKDLHNMDEKNKNNANDNNDVTLPSVDEELAQEELRQIHQRKDSKGDAALQEGVPPYKLQREREAAMTEEEEENYFKYDWPKHEKHIFILSSAGKPVYSRCAQS